MRTGPNLIELPSESGNITKVVCRGSGQRIGQDNHKRRKADERDQKLAPHVVTLASTKRSHAKMVEARGAKLMIFGAHVIVYSKDATVDRGLLQEGARIFICGRWRRLADLRAPSGRSGGSSRRSE